MSVSVQQLADEINPLKTVLFFGSGSSIPSGAPGVQELIEFLAAEHNVSANYTLSEISGVIENRARSRKGLVTSLRKKFGDVRPSGGILNLPLYDWKSIFTTNYDHVIERSYERAKRPIKPVSSNFDFSGDDTPGVVKLYKLHGSIENDVADGHQARLIITENDYEQTEPYREHLYDRLKSDLSGAHLIIIGHSLGDVHIKDIVNRAASLNTKSMGAGKISILIYTKDEDRASLFEQRNIQVCFGGIDEFFAAMAKVAPDHLLVYEDSGSPLDRAVGLRPITVDVGHAISAGECNISAMFNGWPASYADIAGGLTFARNVTDDVSSKVLSSEIDYAVLLGASGVGKTTAARQILAKLHSKGVRCFEHKGDHTLQSRWWRDVAKELKSRDWTGALLIDDAHHHLVEMNNLIEDLASDSNSSLKIIATTSRNHWGPRVKTPHLYRAGKEFLVSRLTGAEVDRLLALVDNNAAFKPLIDDAFSGFSRQERRRRLTVRCESETFVCLKNVFASERFDEIILREYASLSEPLQEVYKLVAAMESAGIKVHRQLIIRYLNIGANKISSVLEQLEDVIHEYPIDERQSVYGWRGRHPVIVDIISKYKFNEVEKISELFNNVIDYLSPTYEIEVRSIRDICNLDTGISRIPDKKVQNTLLRKMMSVAPSERVPRHRLVRNLIDMEEFEKADTEIRIFEKDFKNDGPMARYRLSLMIERALKTQGIMHEDRVAILEQARQYASGAVNRYRHNKNLLSANCDLGVAYYRLTGKLGAFDEAIIELKNAEVRLGDPEISRRVRRFERLITSEAAPEMDHSDDEQVS